MALVGAAVGLVVGLLLSTGWASGSEYETGRRVGFVCRYVVLGAIGFTLAGRLFTERESGSSLPVGAAIGLGVVVLLAVVPPLVQDSPDERRPNEIEAGFMDGCVESSSKQVSAEVARRYCECTLTRLSRGRDTDEFERMMREAERAINRGTQPSSEVLGVAQACARRAG
jgi:hypothetical protein